MKLVYLRPLPRWHPQDSGFIQRKGLQHQRVCVADVHGEGHAGASGDVDSGRWTRGAGQPPSHLPLHQRRGPRGQPPQHQPDPGARRRGVSLHLQQLGRDSFLPGANKRKRCLSDQLFQHTITYTHRHVLIYSVLNWLCLKCLGCAYVERRPDSIFLFLVIRCAASISLLKSDIGASVLRMRQILEQPPALAPLIASHCCQR